MAPSLRKMLGGMNLNDARPEVDADLPSVQRSIGDLKIQSRQQQQRDEEYQRQFPKRNYLQNEDRTDQGVIFPGSVLQERYEVTAGGKKIQRYEKKKTPTSKFAIPQPTSPDPSSIYERDPILDQYASNPSSTRRLTYPDCRPAQVKVVQAQGCDFEMSDKSTGGGKPLTSNPPNIDTSSERGLRSSTRRQERADSHQDDLNVSARDFATTPRDELTVPSLNIRKNVGETPTRIPSPRSSSSPRSPAENIPVPPQTAENERKRATEGPAYTTDPELVKDKRWDAPPVKAAKMLGLQPIRDQTRAMPPVLTPGAPDAINGVVVRPPFYDPSKHATLQWASPGITNSRPAGPWVSCPIYSSKECILITSATGALPALDLLQMFRRDNSGTDSLCQFGVWT